MGSKAERNRRPTAPAPPTTREPRLPRWKKLLFALIPAIVLLILAELSLRVFGYHSPVNDPYESFVEHRPVFAAEGDDFRTQPGRRHFFHDQRFPRQKGADTRRIVVIGGSMTYGYLLPYPLRDNYASLLGRLLESRTPGQRVEVINCGGICYSTYRLTGVLEECLAFRPDAVIIMCGHNEFLEPRHYADLMRRAGPSGLLNRLRLFQLANHLSELARTDRRPTGSSNEFLLSSEQIDERYIVREPAEIEYTRQHFARNIHRMIDRCRTAAVPVILCVEPSNLRDWPPFHTEPSDRLPASVLQARLQEASTHYRAGQFDKSLEVARAVLAIHPSAAMFHYLAARSLEALGQPSAAKQEYLLARDTDAFPHRSPSSFNDSLRAIAKERQVPLFDTESLFMAQTPDGIPGNNLFLDQCHPTPQAHHLIATGLAELIHFPK